ncbi:MAG: disease resistance protein, partial [Hydrogenophilales bacterium RIFOXYD1_FULL_62_11]
SLRDALGPDSVFYDLDYQAQLARPNLDTLLQDIYRKNSELVVVFLSAEYSSKEWCGLEWRAIREIIKQRRDDQLMFVRFDDASIDGVFSHDGYIDAQRHDESAVARFIISRLISMKSAGIE